MTNEKRNCLLILFELLVVECLEVTTDAGVRQGTVCVCVCVHI